ncbi:hypothetical protein FB567DRAFT_598746 [Paraphoma chrysanthemicola]|uniref:Uncharacterized protein n=1 Tax=Paraphoma chrysanthemicola TaxID=798071 RepID=A0A8K0QT95_9PLEO|nr:hypothetical protein FB567DRAFT_598746 [Paraphoma chrysanthemicola]
MKSARDNHKDYSEAHLSMYDDVAIYRDSSNHKHNSVLNTSTLVQQLRAIATVRSSLLLQLNELQDEEVNILDSLAQSIDGTRNPSSHRTSPSTPPPLPPLAPPSPRPLYAPHLPRPNLSPSRLPRAQPSKTSTKPLHTRTVSAPTLSTPVGAQRLAPKSGKRVPLVDKTPLEVKTGEREVLGVGYAEPTHGAAPIGITMGLRKESGFVFPDEERGFAGRKQTRKVAMRFGEDDDESMVGQGLGVSGIGVGKMVSRVRGSRGNGRGVGGARDKSKNQSRSRSRSRGRMPVGTMGSGRGCKVPRAVVGKEWDF